MMKTIWCHSFVMGLKASVVGVFLTIFLAACATSPAPVVDRQALPEGAFGEETANGTQNAPNAVPPQGDFVPDRVFSVCPIQVRNAPPSGQDRVIPTYGQLFVVDRVVALATSPVNGGCLSSGFGRRGERLHKGIDISAPRGSWVYSAAPGIVREAGWGGSFGYYILIDHGYNIYTRYAHLDAFVEGLDIGSELGFGWPIGQVGNSSSVTVGVHLHYEVLTGNYATAKKSFGLNAHNPFEYPVYVPPPAES